jgi:2-phosphoglycerate kinase
VVKQLWQKNWQINIGFLGFRRIRSKILFGHTRRRKNVLFFFSHRYLRGDSNDEFYSKHTPQQIIKDYIVQGKTTYDAISMMAETYLMDEDDFIVEGYEVTPEIVDAIYKKFGRKHIKAVFLVKYDEQKFVQDIHKSITPNDWIIRKTKSETTYSQIAKMVAEYSHYFEREAKKYDLRVFNMDKSFSRRLDAVKKYLKSS